MSSSGASCGLIRTESREYFRLGDHPKTMGRVDSSHDAIESKSKKKESSKRNSFMSTIQRKKAEAEEELARLKLEKLELIKQQELEYERKRLELRLELEKQRAKVKKLEEERRQRKSKTKRKSCTGGKSAVAMEPFVAKESFLAEKSFIGRRSFAVEESIVSKDLFLKRTPFSVKKTFVAERSFVEKPSLAIVINSFYPKVVKPDVVIEKLQSVLVEPLQAVVVESIEINLVAPVHSVVMETLDMGLVKPVSSVVLKPVPIVVLETVPSAFIDIKSFSSSEVGEISLNSKNSCFVEWRRISDRNNGLPFRKQLIVIEMMFKFFMILILQLENKWKSVPNDLCKFKLALEFRTMGLFVCLIFLLVKHLVFMLDGGECYCR